jgi:hypothetical protein
MMKLLPMCYREKQSNWFGQTGMSLHVSHVVLVAQPPPSSTTLSSQSTATASPSKPDRILEHHTFCHFFETCSQSGQTVVSIMRDLLLRLKRFKPNIKSVVVRSDNAGCYHGGEFILAVEQLYHNTGVLIERMDFSEAQAGKSVCDRRSADLKGDCRRHVNEGHDITNSAEFINGAKSTKGFSIIACQVKEKKTSKAVSCS